MKELTLKNLIIDSILTIGLGIIQFYAFFILLLVTYGIFICGNEYLNQWENIRNGFIISLIVFVLQLIFTIKTYKLRTVIVSIGLWVSTFCTLIIIIILGLDTFNYAEYYEEFDSKKWKASKEKPLKMIRVFCKDKRFLGKTRKELVEQLGEDINHYTIHKDQISYRTEAYVSPLVFTMKNDTVIHYELHCKD